MALVRIATVKSRVKRRHVNKYKYTIGEELECKSRLKINIAVMLSLYWRKKKTKSQKETQAKNWIKSRLRLVIFQTLWPKYCFHL